MKQKTSIPEKIQALSVPDLHFWGRWLHDDFLSDCINILRIDLIEDFVQNGKDLDELLSILDIRDGLRCQSCTNIVDRSNYLINFVREKTYGASRPAKILAPKEELEEYKKELGNSNTQIRIQKIDVLPSQVLKPGQSIVIFNCKFKSRELENYIILGEEDA